MQTKTLHLKACRGTHADNSRRQLTSLAIKSLQRGMASLGYLPGVINTLRVSMQARAWQAREVSFTSKN